MEKKRRDVTDDKKPKLSTKNPIDKDKVAENPHLLPYAHTIVEGGLEKFYVRIIDPTGVTLAVEDLGSGILTTNTSNEEIRYTKVKEIDYNNEATEACMLWEPNTEFQQGKYNIEVFNKGFMAGKGSFELK